MHPRHQCPFREAFLALGSLTRYIETLDESLEWLRIYILKGEHLPGFLQRHPSLRVVRGSIEQIDSRLALGSRTEEDRNLVEIFPL